MSKPEIVQIREAYGEALLELGRQNPKVVALDADVSSSTKSAYFGKAFPERFFNVGIAELNMVSMSAGFASSGLIPFCNAFAIFLALRGGDAIQSLIAHDKLNVKLAAGYAGYSAGVDGSSHHAITDIAEVRAMPNMNVITVCDAVSTRKAVFAAAAFDGPIYLRLSRAAVETIYDDNWEYTIGGSNQLRAGSDLTILAAGPMVQKAIIASERLKEEGISARVIDCYSIKPLDEAAILAAARETGAIVTAEEHNRYGGFGSAVCELIAQKHPVPVEIVAIEDTFSESGTYEQLNEKYGLTPENIYEKAKKVLARK